MGTVLVGVRLEEKSVEQLQKLVYEGEFTNLSEAVRYCVRMQLKQFSRTPPPPMAAVLDFRPPSPSGGCTSIGGGWSPGSGPGRSELYHSLLTMIMLVTASRIEAMIRSGIAASIS